MTSGRSSSHEVASSRQAFDHTSVEASRGGPAEASTGLLRLPSWSASLDELAADAIGRRGTRTRWGRPSPSVEVAPEAGWGGYGSSKAALDQLTAILAAEHPELRVYAADPGDMRTQMHQEAFPGEDISDRPPPEASVPGLLG